MKQILFFLIWYVYRHINTCTLVEPKKLKQKIINSIELFE